MIVVDPRFDRIPSATVGRYHGDPEKRMTCPKASALR
jgi:hypothetical protein